MIRSFFYFVDPFSSSFLKFLYFCHSLLSLFFTSSLIDSARDLNSR